MQYRASDDVLQSSHAGSVDRTARGPGCRAERRHAPGLELHPRRRPWILPRRRHTDMGGVRADRGCARARRGRVVRVRDGSDRCGDRPGSGRRADRVAGRLLSGRRRADHRRGARRPMDHDPPSGNVDRRLVRRRPNGRPDLGRVAVEPDARGHRSPPHRGHRTPIRLDPRRRQHTCWPPRPATPRRWVPTSRCSQRRSTSVATPICCAALRPPTTPTSWFSSECNGNCAVPHPARSRRSWQHAGRARTPSVLTSPPDQPAKSPGDSSSTPPSRSSATPDCLHIPHIGSQSNSSPRSAA